MEGDSAAATGITDRIRAVPNVELTDHMHDLGVAVVRGSEADAKALEAMDGVRTVMKNHDIIKPAAAREATDQAPTPDRKLPDAQRRRAPRECEFIHP